MQAELNQHIDQLRHMTTAQLQLKYRELFGQASRSNQALVQTRAGGEIG
jgi:hypothetical protein